MLATEQKVLCMSRPCRHLMILLINFFIFIWKVKEQAGLNKRRISQMEKE